MHAFRRIPMVRRSSILLAAAAAALAFPLGALAVHQFSDVPTAASYHDDVEALVAAGITTGCGDGKYCPADPVTRAQMAQFLNRLGSLDGNTPPSVDAATIADLTGRIGALNGRARSIHLAAHLETTALLNDTQVADYNRLRGYTAPAAGAAGHSGH